MLSLVLDPRAWLAVLLAAVLGGSVGWVKGAARVRLEVAAQQADQERELRRMESARQRASQEVQDDYAKKAAASRRAVAAARSELDRMRNLLAARAAEAVASAGGVDAAAPERGVVGDCSEALTGMAAAADDERERLRALQEWVRGVLNQK